MCLMAPGLVTAVDTDTAQVSVDGMTRTALTLLTPDVQPGDWVLVGAGAVLRRVDAAQAISMRHAVDVATGSADPADSAAIRPTTSEPRGDAP